MSYAPFVGPYGPSPEEADRWFIVGVLLGVIAGFFAGIALVG